MQRLEFVLSSPFAREAYLPLLFRLDKAPAFRDSDTDYW